jgi:hypothetical protein
MRPASEPRWRAPPGSAPVSNRDFTSSLRVQGLIEEPEEAILR